MDNSIAKNENAKIASFLNFDEQKQGKNMIKNEHNKFLIPALNPENIKVIIPRGIYLLIFSYINIPMKKKSRD